MSKGKGCSKTLGENLIKWLNSFQIYTNDLFRVCWNLDCECYEFYKREHNLEKLTIEHLFDIAENYSYKLYYKNPENAHIMSSSECNKYDEITVEQTNSADNGIRLCPNCHKKFDRNGGKFAPDPDAKEVWLDSKESILESKQFLIDYLN